jgi:hypothetical protein
VAFRTYVASRSARTALALVFGVPVAARAEDGKVDVPPRTVAFGSVDAGSSGFATIGAKRTLVGTLDESGPVALASFGAGGSPEQMGLPRLGEAAFRPAVQGSALIGYQWALGRTFLSLFAGPEVDHDRFSSASGLTREATRIGGRVHGEIWMHPTDDTLVTGRRSAAAPGGISGPARRAATRCGATSSSARRRRSTGRTRTASGALAPTRRVCSSGASRFGSRPGGASRRARPGAAATAPSRSM